MGLLWEQVEIVSDILLLEHRISCTTVSFLNFYLFLFHALGYPLASEVITKVSSSLSWLKLSVSKNG